MLLADVHGPIYINRLGVTGLKTKHEYVVSQKKEGKNLWTWACSCKGWIFSLKRLGFRACDHLYAMGLQGLSPGANPPKQIIEIIGSLRWYSQTAQRFGKVNIAE